MGFLKQFPHRIVVSIRSRGAVVSTVYYEHFVGQRDDDLVEIVVDDQRQAWEAKAGMLLPMGTKFGEVPNYQDPRTRFNAVCNADHPDEVTGFVWVDAQTKEVVEEHIDDDEDPMVKIPPDRRDEPEWAAIMPPVEA